MNTPNSQQGKEEELSWTLRPSLMKRAASGFRSRWRLKGEHRALVTALDEPPSEVMETALLSEAALSDRLQPEEDAAWAHLQ